LSLALVFLAAQFHFCADFTPGSASHFCPFCATAGAAIAASAPTIGFAPANAQIELPSGPFAISPGALLSLSPRAPPSL